MFHNNLWFPPAVACAVLVTEFAADSGETLSLHLERDPLTPWPTKQRTATRCLAMELAIKTRKRGLHQMLRPPQK